MNLGLAFLLGTGAVVLGITDTIFTVYDAKVMADGERPALGWAVAETAVTVPQAVLLDALVVAAADEKPLAAILLVPTAWVNGLAAHGIWAVGAEAAEKNPHPDALGAVPYMIGANTTLTTLALGRAFQGELEPPSFAIAAMVGSAPSVAIGAYESAVRETDRPGWIALTAWSGAIFVHGATSLIVGDDGDGYDDAAASGLNVAVAPTVLAGPRGPAPGIALAGSF